MDNGSYLAFFEAPERPFEFKNQHDYDLHIAVEVDNEALHHMFEKAKAEGREVRGISNHGFIHSIYFRHPNGYVIELTAKQPGGEDAMDPARNGARRILDAWQKEKRRRRSEPGAASTRPSVTRIGSNGAQP